MSDLHFTFFHSPVSRREQKRWKENIAIIKAILDEGSTIFDINEDRVYFQRLTNREYRDNDESA